MSGFPNNLTMPENSLSPYHGGCHAAPQLTSVVGVHVAATLGKCPILVEGPIFAHVYQSQIRVMIDPRSDLSL